MVGTSSVLTFLSATIEYVITIMYSSHHISSVSQQLGVNRDADNNKTKAPDVSQ